MTAYDYHNLPEDFDNSVALPAELTAKAKALFLQQLAENPHIVAEEVRIGHLYERKDILEIAPIGPPVNKSYQRATDDVFYQLTFRVPHYAVGPEIAELETDLAELKATEARAKAEEEIAKLDQQAAEAEAAAEAARLKRDELIAKRDKK